MKRRMFLAGMACAALPVSAWSRTRFERGLLWRVSGKRGARSHVFGTIHEPDARLAELPAPVGAAFEGASSLMVEFLPDAYAEQRFLEAALLPAGETLDALIGADYFARAVEELAPVGLGREVVARLKPWAVLLNLSHPRQPAGETPEALLIERARQRGLAIEQIERVEEQIFTFDECPMASQVALVRHSLEHRAELVELAGSTLSAYLARDLARIWRLREDFIARYPAVAADQAVLTKRVLHDRSVVMAFRMQRALRRGNAFIAVGALHLYGAKGVLALLEQDGYHATRAY